MDRHRLPLNLAPRHCYSPTTGVCTNAEKLCWCATLCTLSTSENSFCLNISLQRWLCCYWTSSVADNNIPDLASVLFCSVLQPSSIPRLATPWTYFLHLSVLCHSDWLFHRESCPRIDVVHPGRVWSSSPACIWHCSLHYLSFSRQLPCFLMVWP